MDERGRSAAIASSPETARPEDASLFDKAVLLKLAEETGPDVIPGLVGSFLGHLESRVEKITVAVGAADPQTLEFETHTLGGSAATFGAMKLHHLARNIEAVCQAKDGKRALELAATLADYLKALS